MDWTTCEHGVALDSGQTCDGCEAADQYERTIAALESDVCQLCQDADPSDPHPHAPRYRPDRPAWEQPERDGPEPTDPTSCHYQHYTESGTFLRFCGEPAAAARGIHAPFCARHMAPQAESRTR